MKNLQQEMAFEYETLRDYFLENCTAMSESEFNYSLGKLNALAGWTGNLQDYALHVLAPVAAKIKNL